MAEKLMKVTGQEFRDLVIDVCHLDQWNDFCRNEVTYSEWLQLSTEEKKTLFNNYIKEVELSEIIDQEYWEGIFEKEPKIIGIDEEEFVEGIEAE